AHQVAELAAETVADRADLAVALGALGEILPSVLHVAHPEVVVELVVEIERLLDVLGIAVGKLDAGFLAPEQVGYEAHEPWFGELLRMMPHGFVDAPDLHDGDDRASRRPVGNSDVGAHLAVAELDLDVLGFHTDSLHNLSPPSSEEPAFAKAPAGRLDLSAVARRAKAERWAATTRRCARLLTMREWIWRAGTHHSLISFRALPEKICSRSAAEISSL